jgi:CheY-like chemotaxis protein
MSIKRIILGDDDREMCEEVSEALEDSGYNVCCVHCGEDVIEKVKKEKLSIVLLDLKMPGIGGYEAFKKIKKINSKIPIIFVTGSLPSDVEKQLKLVRFTRILYKPFDIEKLIKEIDKVSKEGNTHD